MKLAQINPYIRFASLLRYAAKSQTVRVTDCRLIYITEGSGRIILNGESYALEECSLVYCAAGSTYSIESNGSFSLLCLNYDLSLNHSNQENAFPPCADPDQWGAMPIFSDPVSDSAFLNSHLYVEDGSSFQRKIESIVEHFSESAPFSRELCSAELKQVLVGLHRLQSAQLPPKIALVMEYIRRHYREELTNERLADLVGYHAYHLNRLFAAATGTTLHGYVLRQRLNRACYLLLNTDLDLKELPEQTGFRSYPHFSSYFKRVYGVSPVEYRRQFRSTV